MNNNTISPPSTGNENVQPGTDRARLNGSAWRWAGHLVNGTARKYILGAVAFTLGACAQPQNLVAGDKMSVDTPIYEHELGSERESTVAVAAKLWLSEPECEIQKTGVGVNRRAYFLEMCTFQNPQQQTVCQLAPESIEYAFLEGDLVQVRYQFAEADEASYGACVEEQAVEHGFSVLTEAMESDTADTRRVRLIDEKSGMGITVGEERQVRVYDAKRVKDIHMLNTGI